MRLEDHPTVRRVTKKDQGPEYQPAGETLVDGACGAGSAARLASESSDSG